MRKKIDVRLVSTQFVLIYSDTMLIEYLLFNIKV